MIGIRTRQFLGRKSKILLIRQLYRRYHAARKHKRQSQCECGFALGKSIAGRTREQQVASTLANMPLRRSPSALVMALIPLQTVAKPTKRLAQPSLRLHRIDRPTLSARRTRHPGRSQPAMMEFRQTGEKATMRRMSLPTARIAQPPTVFARWMRSTWIPQGTRRGTRSSSSTEASPIAMKFWPVFQRRPRSSFSIRRKMEWNRLLRP